MAICSPSEFKVVRQAAKEYLESLYKKWGPQDLLEKDIDLNQPDFFRELLKDERLLGPKTPEGWDPTSTPVLPFR